MQSKYDHLVTKEMLEDYYGEEVENWLIVEHNEHMTLIDYPFITVLLKDRSDILPLKSYLRHYKLHLLFK